MFPRFFIICLMPLWLNAQKDYPVDSIPSVLLENADAVIRLENTVFKIKDKGSATLIHQYVVTVFNERGASDHLRYVRYYNSLNKIDYIRGNVFDKNGNRIYKLSQNDIYDVSSDALTNSITDDRKKIAEFDHKGFQFPYTIEFISSLQTTNLMAYPTECFYAYERKSTQEKNLVIETPPDFFFRYKEKNMPAQVNVVSEKNKKRYTWTVKNISANEYEYYTPPGSYAKVIAAPKEFSVEKYTGDITSWNDIGKFISKLNQHRDTLPESVKLKIAKLVNGERDTLKKIELLYQYLQSNTRFVSIQLGIGGWQSMTAMEVANKGYGDCKALSNYMKALLKEAGITSYQALIRSGSYAEDIETDFPNISFDHVVNCVPLGHDTIWLECTSQTVSLGFPGSFTGNRKALLILPNGGVLVNTTTYRSFDNCRITKMNLIVDENGNAQARSITRYTGILKEQQDHLLQERNDEKLRKVIQSSIRVPSFELKKYTLLEHKSRLPDLELTLDLTIQKIGNKTGSLFFMKPYVMNSTRLLIQAKKNRRSGFYLNPNEFEKEETDSLTFQIPKTFHPEYLPEAVSIKTQFGEYRASVIFKDGNLIYYRKLVLHSGLFSVGEYAAWEDFCKAVNKNDNQQIAFKVN
jgi:hypothetical protein